MEPGLRERLLTALDAAGIAAEVVLTENRTTMVSVRAKRTLRGTRLLDREVRIARRFAELGDVVVAAIVDYVADRPGASARVHELIRQLPPEAESDAGGATHATVNRAISAPGSAPRYLRRLKEPPIRSRGLHHDLAELGEIERREHFPDMPAIPIGWGRREPRRRALRSIRLGSYESSSLSGSLSGPVVRIHPRLDDPRVPAWFIGFVIFHELLHHALGVHMSPRGDRRELHPAGFREAETRHPRYAEALAWEDANITALLSPEW